MTDFVGFTYNNVHSSSLGIVRTSDGSRFNENLLPTIQDKTVQVPIGLIQLWLSFQRRRSLVVSVRWS